MTEPHIHDIGNGYLRMHITQSSTGWTCLICGKEIEPPTLPPPEFYPIGEQDWEPLWNAKPGEKQGLSRYTDTPERLVLFKEDESGELDTEFDILFTRKGDEDRKPKSFRDMGASEIENSQEAIDRYTGKREFPDD